jgi:23S rRNA (guanosine2251-2'-O)-methyltransferase
MRKHGRPQGHGPQGRGPRPPKDRPPGGSRERVPGRSQERSQERSQDRAGDRAEGRPDGRTHKRHESRGESRGESRVHRGPESHAEGRPKARTHQGHPGGKRKGHAGGRPEGRAEGRSHKPFASRTDKRAPPRPEARPEARPDARAKARPQTRPQKPSAPRAESRPPMRAEARPEPRPVARAAFSTEKPRLDSPAPPRQGEVWLYGHHAVAAALANPARKVLRLIGTAEALAKLADEPGIPPAVLGNARTVARRDVDIAVGENAVHQGLAALMRTLDYNLMDILEMAAVKPNACLMVLDQVTDPHNVGAVLRSAAAFGASAVIAPDRHAPDESGVMAKSASGALDKIPYVKTTNLVRALEQIKEARFWLVGLDAEADQVLGAMKLEGRIALVVGAEGEGLRRLVRETCDHVARLPMAGDMESLNVSNAAAVALYEKVRQDGK